MKTLIEIYDEDYLKNITAPLMDHYDQIIYVCENINERRISALSELFNDSIVKAIEFKNHSYEMINHLFTNLDDVYVELNGGNGLLLINLIKYCLKYDIKCFYIDHNHKIIENINRCDHLKYHQKQLSLKQLINLSGAKITSTSHYQPDMQNKILIKDICKVFNVMKENFKEWTQFMQVLINLLGKDYNQVDNSVYFKKNNKELLDNIILKKLSEAGILKYQNGPEYYIQFKNKIIKHLFKDAGAWLEYYTYIQIEKSKLFSDCMMSVVIDYDGDIEEKYMATCEIDVMCVKDLYPIFISCKANKVDADALNEIKLHALTFGNSESKAIVVTGANLEKENPGIYKKAKELEVYIIDNESVVNGNIAQEIQRICKGKYIYKELE